MKRRIALLIAVGLMGSGCDLNSVVPATQQALQAPSDPAASDDNAKPGPTGSIKYPERPPCKVCINHKTWNNPNGGGMP